ncbi:hypothetical protein WOLCODRAFT_24307 [Wolfiporia cocos MD-104 SS10]|uniref:SET domain-containing protein n=1 Tax=Wolfiporia cocos (strain MD-104) TaxID=742152 RepID=A0A2H3JFZ8_WOLCO|nr:hypothetical protein WOLCODRAFT_24307 [Wolfiporia cocos MD-104 SS10]
MHPNDESVISWISRSQRRFEESQLGNYDWAGMFRDSKNDPRLDVADYMGPMEVRSVDNQRGWGTIATRDVKPGELLLVSKAFDYFTTKDETDGL